MLQSLTMKNVALIESATISFTSGLNVLSGETGSGKSVVVDSLNFVLGGKADKAMIRSGAAECSVQAVFSSEERIADLISSLGYEPDDDLLIISRRFSTEGKGEIRINGQPASATILKKITSRLVDVHGQSEHFALLKPNFQLKFIDNYHDQIAPTLEKLKHPSLKLKEIAEKKELLGGSDFERAQKLDILSFQISEIENANLAEGEEEELVALRKKLLNAEKIAESMQRASSLLTEDNGAVDAIRGAIRAISSVASYDQEYEAIFDRLTNAFSEMEDIAETVSDCASSIETDESELSRIEDRLDLIHSLYRKYGGSHDAVIAFLENAQKEYDFLFNSAQELLLLDKERDVAIKEIYQICKDLRSYRQKAAQTFSQIVMKELAELGMGRSVVDVAFNEFPTIEETESSLTSTGFDAIEILLSPNLGEPTKPLAKIISGGEMSRFMLAIKAQYSRTGEIDTCVFDEIDTGISGKIAKVVAEKFYHISKTSQLIAISHLPQIAAMADTSILIYKTEENGKTHTKTKTLSDEEKVIEVTRLIGGEVNDATAIAHAKNMIMQANEYKTI